jgi:tetratricopeptide (TPR) repeat protein
MARNPDERPGSAGELAAHLAGALKNGTATRRTRRLATSRTRLAAPVQYAPQPASAERRDAVAGRPPPAWFVPTLIGVALAAIMAIVLTSSLSSGDDAGGSVRERSPAGTQQPAAKEKHKRKPPKDKLAVTPPAGPSDAVPAATGSDPAAAAQLNDRGFALMGEGRFDEAVPLLEQAVRAADPQAADATYAYALFNLGSSLRQAGRPREAVPVLERRLTIPNQTQTVRKELERARREAGSG